MRIESDRIRKGGPLAKFKLGPAEKILKKTAVIYYPPETKDMNAFKAAFKAKIGVAFLTSSRFVGATKLVEFPWGVLIWLIKWMLGRNIIFQVALADIKSVKKVEKTTQMVVGLNDGSECLVAFDTFLDARDKWVAAIGDAIASADPAAKLDRSEGAVEIARA
jgi:hypothetical protein